MNNLTTIYQIWLTMIIWFVVLSIVGVVVFLYARYRKKTFDERFQKRHKEINDRWVGQIPPVKNPLPPPPELKNAMPRAVAPNCPIFYTQYLAQDDEIVVYRKSENKNIR